MKKFTIGILPQKPVEIRYQQEWFDYLVNNCNQLESANNVSLKIIYDQNQLTKANKINSSDFFDSLVDNISWDSRQLELLFETVSDYDALLFMDISFTGLFTSIIPLLRLGKPDLKLYGFCHATSLNKGDIFMNTRKIKWNLEKYVIKNFDAIFVSTEYHKNKLIKIGNLNKDLHDKIIVTYGLPVSDIFFELSGKTDITTSKQVLLPSRINKQKISMQRKEELKNLLSKEGYQLVESYSVAKTRKEYQELISNSLAVVVVSNEDTFGYPLAESSAAGVPCFAINRCCYPEILLQDSLFTNFQEFISKLKSLHNSNINKYKLKQEYVMKHDTFWNKLIKHMLKKQEV